ncbi:MAG: YciI-like protein [Pirellula sp.]
MQFLLKYEADGDYAERRAPFRQEHLKLAHEAAARGDLLLGGAFADPVDGALLVFSSEESANAFVNADPYVQNGVITHWSIRKWTTVAGCLLEYIESDGLSNDC